MRTKPHRPAALRRLNSRLLARFLPWLFRCMTRRLAPRSCPWLNPLACASCLQSSWIFWSPLTQTPFLASSPPPLLLILSSSDTGTRPVAVIVRCRHSFRVTACRRASQGGCVYPCVPSRSTRAVALSALVPIWPPYCLVDNVEFSYFPVPFCPSFTSLLAHFGTHTLAQYSGQLLMSPSLIFPIISVSLHLLIIGSSCRHLWYSQRE